MHSKQLLAVSDGWCLLQRARRATPVNTKHLCNICTMLDQRRRRWPTLYKWYTNDVCLLGRLKARLARQSEKQIQPDLKFIPSV